MATYAGRNAKLTTNSNERGAGVRNALALLAAAAMLASCGSDNGTKWVEESEPINLFQSHISAGDFLFLRVTVDDVDGRNFRLSGSFVVTDGGSRDIRAYVMDDRAFVNFQNGNEFQVMYQSGLVTTAELRVDFGEAGTYYLVFDNRSSLLTAKTLDAELEATWESRRK